jgi:hypothetical protein
MVGFGFKSFEKKQADESIYSKLNILKIRYYPVSKPVRVVVLPVGLGLPLL